MLLAVCVLTGLLGWWLGPAVSGAPAVPSIPDIAISFGPPLVGVHVDETLAEVSPGKFYYYLRHLGGP